MAKILFKTFGDASPSKKPRVYFTCHPEDFSRYFETVCADLFKAHDCAVYYTEDMTATLSHEEKSTDLESANLLVVPVTFRLLTEKSRAMDSDVPYALERHIPILPLMMEPGLDALYARADRFGELQYLSPCSTDCTEVGYQEKLKTYLSSMLVSDALAQQIRAAFSAYIFLSYRKKDRYLANQLLSRIHSDPAYQDVAVWYDEFLTPGESFRENISRVLRDSRLFALLVTPNLLEEPDGKPNFVMQEEFPQARDQGVPVLPIEMVATQRSTLEEKFPGLPACIAAENETQFRLGLQACLQQAQRKDARDPLHTLLIGLAYLEGIDVEVDRTRAVALITTAAQAGSPEAMEKLSALYLQGAGVALDYQQAAHWAQQRLQHLEATLGPEHPDTLAALDRLVYIRGFLEDPQTTLPFAEAAYTGHCRLHGQNHPDTLVALNNLAMVLGHLGQLQQALELSKQVYQLRKAQLGQAHLQTITSMDNLAHAYISLGMYEKALPLRQQAFALFGQLQGKLHSDTLIAMDNLALALRCVGKQEEAKALGEEAYALSCQIFGETHPQTLAIQTNLAVTCQQMHLWEAACTLQEAVYAQSQRILGPEHPHTVTVMGDLAYTYYQLERHDLARERMEQVYNLREKLLGPEHPDTLLTANNLSLICFSMGDYPQALRLAQETYMKRRRVLGDSHPHTLHTLSNLTGMQLVCGHAQEALELLEEAYLQYGKVLGASHPKTLEALAQYANVCYSLDDPRALPLLEQLYRAYYQVLSPKDPKTKKVFSLLYELYYPLVDCDEEAERWELPYAIYRNVLGIDHPATIHTLAYMASYYLWDRGDARRALPLYEHLYDLRKKALGEEHEDSVAALEGIADACMETGDPQRAMALAQQSLALRIKLHGSQSPEALDALDRVEEFRLLLEGN